MRGAGSKEDSKPTITNSKISSSGPDRVNGTSRFSRSLKRMAVEREKREERQLNRRKDRVIALTMLGWRQNKIAKKVHVGVRTIYGWLKEADFVGRIRHGREVELRSVENTVIYGARVALHSLAKEAREAVDSKDRIRAAEILLTKCFELRPEYQKRALVEVQQHAHLDLSHVSDGDLRKFLLKAEPKPEPARVITQ